MRSIAVILMLILCGWLCFKAGMEVAEHQINNGYKRTYYHLHGALAHQARHGDCASVQLVLENLHWLVPSFGTGAQVHRDVGLLEEVRGLVMGDDVSEASIAALVAKAKEDGE